MNCPFLMFTGTPVAAAAIIRSVWRHKKAGVCSMSTTCPANVACSGVCTSVNTGSPVSDRTASSICNPASKPGPLKEAPEERLPLSKDDLYIRGISSADAILESSSAVRSAFSRLSMTHGPTIKNRSPADPLRRLNILTLRPYWSPDDVRRSDVFGRLLGIRQKADAHRAVSS